MTILFVLFGIFYTIILGFSIIRVILENLNFYTTAGLSFAVGIGFIYLQLFSYVLLGIEWNLFNILVPGILIIIITFLLKRNYLINKISIKPSLLFIPIFLVCLYVLFESISRPLLTWDGWAHWFLKSKIFYFNNGISPDDFFYTNSDYPLVLPVYITFLYKLLGLINDKFVLISYAFLYISLLIIFYQALKRYVNYKKAILFTFLLALLQNIIRHSGYYETGISDLPLSYFIFTDFFLYLLTIKSRNIFHHILLQLMIGITALIKNEGLAFALVIESVVIFNLIRYKNYKMLISLLFFLIPWQSWELYKSHHQISMNYFIINRRSNLDSFFVILGAFLKEMLNIKNWNLLWCAYLLGFINTIVSFKKIPNKVVYVLIFGQLAAYYTMFLITPVNVSVHLGILDRLYIHIAPLVVFAIAMNFADKKQR